MKRVILKLVILLTTLLLFVGFAYAAWSDDVDINVNAGTGVTKLKITEWDLISGDGSKLNISRNDNKATIKANNLQDGEQIVITFTGKNTGTIPVDVDEVMLYNMVLTDGNKNDDKNINIDVQIYSGGNLVGSKNSKLSDGDNRKSVDVIVRNGVRLVSGQEVKVVITLSYEKKGNDKDNNGNGNDKNQGSKEVSFDFNMGIIYSRFNQ